ncbi:MULTISPECIES: hypothetical protein [Lactobacillus]|jgi:hypothetical protein|uniref:hypothetical protein n=1 Tax=Lactobacillus TaxID=1578 RepID=UPI001F58A287|nr:MULTISPECIES: hypothetical protein [Lactobacillus]MDE7050869.1 hypothetical protein [Lactobacillus sp.]UNL44575.1 hypothetical protein G8B21_05190 [Lactobacillus gasseri]
MNKNLKKTLWFALLFFDVFVFEQGIVHSNIPTLILAAILAGIINFAGNESMFGDFERNQKEKILARKKQLEMRKKKASERQ